MQEPGAVIQHCRGMARRRRESQGPDDMHHFLEKKEETIGTAVVSRRPHEFRSRVVQAWPSGGGTSTHGLAWGEFADMETT